MPTNEKGKLSGFFYSKFFIAAVIIAFGFIVFAFLRSFFQDYQVRQEIARLKSEANELETKKLEMFEILQYVRSDDYAEEKARLEFNLMKPGEKTVIVKGASATPPINGQVDNKMIESNRLSNPLKWLNIFLK